MSSSRRPISTALLATLASSMIAIVAVSTASAASFGTGVYGAIWDPAINESDSDYFERDPSSDSNGIPLSFDGNSILTPDGPSHSDGITAASLSLTRSGARVAGSANLATGTLTAYANGDAPYINLLTAGFSETLTPLEDGLQRFDLVVTGTNIGDSIVGGIWFAIDDTILRGQRGEPDADSCLTTLGTIECQFTFFVPVQADSSYRVAWALQVSASSGTIDWENTATMSVSGPEYTSASGVFLSEAVPAPGSLPLLLAGFVGLAARRRWQASGRQG